ncbi:MAG: hypothetical protein JJT78_09010 [Leptospira sp.]|nr:hypothetical protein [Leptospira sp.]
MNPKYAKKFSPCVKPSLPPFRFKRDDIEQSNIRKVFSRLKEQSQLEGKTRASSVRCLRKLKLDKKEEQALESALESMFGVENSLFFTYTRFLDSATGIDRTRNKAFLKSRYDLMIVIQTKTKDWVLGYEDEEDSRLDEDFSNLYLSVLRTYYDFYLELDPVTRNKVFDRLEGR